MIDSFIQYIKIEKRQSEHSVIAYKSDLYQLQDYLELQYNVSIAQTNHQMLRSWLVSLKNQGLTNKTLHRKVSSIKSYFRYLLRKQIVAINPTNKIVLPKTEKRLPNVINKNEVANMLQPPQNNTSDFQIIRNHLIVTLFYQCGIRLSELINLEITNISPQSIKVIGKRNKERIIPIIEKVHQSIQYYITLRNIEFQSNCPYLFVKNDGQKTYPKFVYNVVHNELNKYTTQKKKSPHVLRHTFATHMLDEGADLNAIKELLGHSNLMATQIYTHNSLSKIKSIYKQAHPRAQ